MQERRLQNKKNLEDIRPAVGLKIKSNKEKPEPPKQEKPKIINDVKVEEELGLPTEEALRILNESAKTKENLLNNMKSFNSLLKIRTLIENKTDEEKKKEQEVVGKLAQAAMEVESISPGEGLLSMSIVAIRQALSLRDACNEMAYKIIQMEKKIKKLEEGKGEKEAPFDQKIDMVETKKQMLEISDMLKKIAQGGSNG
jgi:hypothetical protein